MELACPNCETRFVVAENAIGPNGRKVRCSNCGHVWHANPEPPMELTTPAPAATDDFNWQRANTTQQQPAQTEDPYASPMASAFTPERRKRRGGKRMVLGVILLVAIGATYGLRDKIVERYPQAVKWYSLAGIPVAGSQAGLEVADVQFGPATEGGLSVIRVTGLITNAGSGALSVPQLEVTLTAKDGTRFARKTFRSPQPVVEPNQPARFQYDIVGEAAIIGKADVRLVESGA